MLYFGAIKIRSSALKSKSKTKSDKPKKQIEPEIPNEDLPFKKGFFRDWFEVIMYGLAIFMFLKGFVFQNFQIPTSSMENSLLIGDHLTANKCVYSPYVWDWERSILPIKPIERGDVVVFKYPKDVRQDYIKRCIGLPGDRFEIRNHQVYINGQPLREGYTYYKDLRYKGRDKDNANYPLHFETLKPGIENAEAIYPVKTDVTMKEFMAHTRRSLLTLAPINSPYYKEWIQKLSKTDGFTVPDDFYLMMGDNRNLSEDSRFWGLVPRPLIEGRAYCIWWSYGEEENTHTLKGFDLVWTYLRVPIRFFTHTHWERCFDIIE